MGRAYFLPWWIAGADSFSAAWSRIFSPRPCRTRRWNEKGYLKLFSTRAEKTTSAVRPTPPYKLPHLVGRRLTERGVFSRSVPIQKYTTFSNPSSHKAYQMSTEAD